MDSNPDFYYFDAIIDFEKTINNKYTLICTYVINQVEIATFKREIGENIIDSDAWNNDEPTLDIQMTIANGITYAEIYSIGKPVCFGFFTPSIRVTKFSIENKVSVFCCPYTKKWRTVFVPKKGESKMLVKVYNQ